MILINYEKVKEMLLANGISMYKLLQVDKKTGKRVLSEATVQRLRNGESVTLNTIDILCEKCGCQPGDILSYAPSKPKRSKKKQAAI